MSSKKYDGHKERRRAPRPPKGTTRSIFSRALGRQDVVLASQPRDRDGALARVKSLLLAAGVTPEEIDQAVANDVLDLLAVDCLLLPSPARYSQQDVSRMTGLPLALMRRFWRALGFSDVAEDERVFTDMDIKAVGMFQTMLEMGVADIDTALQLARVIGSSMARIAEAEVIPGSMTPGTQEDSILAADAFASVADSVIPAMAELLEFVWRRHIRAATRRTMLLRTHGKVVGASPVLSVGFADMVGFTLLSQHVSDESLAEIVRRFEELSHDTVTRLGGRVVKMIGDEVMFVVDGVVPAARIGLGLAEEYSDDELLSDVRVGLAMGPVLARDGDYYGATVNLAHRIVNIGTPGAVIMSDDFHTALMEQAGDEFTGKALRPRVLKDMGRVQLWWCGRAGTEVNDSGRVADERRSLRWDRMAEVLRDLEALRDVGERIVGQSRRGLASDPDETGSSGAIEEAPQAPPQES
ncbi:MAG: adenylate/guanylate cyclase domain-containing protein [Acidimicrobiales bacterium]